MKSLLKIGIILVLIAFLCLPAIAKGKGKAKKEKTIEPQKIEYQSKDRFNIVANLYLPLNIEKNTRVPLVIFIHEIAQNKDIWKPYAIELAEKGYSVLSIDLRGHGESVLDKKHKKKFWRGFQKDDWENIEYDVVNGIDYLKNNYPEINTEKIIIAGSSMGSCVAIKAAEKEKQHVKGLILLSPFTDYKGIEARVALVNYGAHPILIIVSKTDSSSFKSTEELVKYSQGTHQIVLIEHAGHGIFMLKFEPKLKDIMYDWLAKNLPPDPEPVPASAVKTKK